MNAVFPRRIGPTPAVGLIILVGVLTGALVAVLVFATLDYGLFAPSQSPAEATNLSESEATVLARAFADEQLRLFEETSTAAARGFAAAVTPEGSAPSHLELVQKQFLAADSPSTLASTRAAATAGAWLFVFQAHDITVPEWKTREASLEIQVVLSDESGRILQSGSALLPPTTDAAARP